VTTPPPEALRALFAFWDAWHNEIGLCDPGDDLARQRIASLLTVDDAHRLDELSDAIEPHEEALRWVLGDGIQRDASGQITAWRGDGVRSKELSDSAMRAIEICRAVANIGRQYPAASVEAGVASRCYVAALEASGLGRSQSGANARRASLHVQPHAWTERCGPSCHCGGGT